MPHNLKLIQNNASQIQITQYLTRFFNLLLSCFQLHSYAIIQSELNGEVEFMLSIRSMSTKMSNLLIAPHVENRVVVNFWSPGYKIKETVKDKDGKERKIQRFYPTTTTETALSYLIKRYGQDAYLTYKDDIHPGHCSIATKKQYLSVGTSDELENIGITTHHKLIYTKYFTKEVLAFKRFPRKKIGFLYFKCG